MSLAPRQSPAALPATPHGAAGVPPAFSSPHLAPSPNHHGATGVPPAFSSSHHTPPPNHHGAAGVSPASSSSHHTPPPNHHGAAGVPPASSSPHHTPPPNHHEAAGVSPASSFAFYDGQRREHTGNLRHIEHAGAHFFITFRLHTGRLTAPERDIVLNACRFWHGARYYLGAAVVMPDHVHLLLRTIQQPDHSWPTLSGLIHSIKSFTAHRILKQRGSPGPLWQAEYFDKIMRSDREYENAVEYILDNPRRAGLPPNYPHVHRYQSARVAGGSESLHASLRMRVQAGVHDAGGTPAPPLVSGESEMSRP